METYLAHNIIHTLETDIGRFDYYPNFVIGCIKEGVHVTFEEAIISLQTAAQIYTYDKRFVYISNRVYSYSIDPMGYREASKMFINLVGLAVVAKSKKRRTLAGLERMFMKQPIRAFKDLESAFQWTQELLEKEKAS
ncbi:hypothetical protein [Maribacter sp. 2210JD10-5]|uniref:hypothetical protein n=1 Tax=Maribacter sp. 2210JD10-5 TaxID=3386272 RepID=UPI0039BCE18F